MESVAPKVMKFFIELLDKADFQFKPGQFITLDLPISGKRLKRWRSYSIANAPNEEGILEIIVVRLEGGEGTAYLFEELKIGDIIKFKGPSGNFVLPNAISKDLVFICTGTGVAPFRSMIQHIYQSDISHRHIHLIFGCRTQEDILYRKEFCNLHKKHDDFTYSVCLSRDKNWLGLQGYVHQVYMDTYKEVSKEVTFYLCGWSEMVDEAVENLVLNLGYDKKQIIYELYG